MTSLAALVIWLEAAGCERVLLLDNASSFEPLLDYYRESPHEVVRLPENLGARALWLAGLVPNTWFVYTDPDIVPIEACPLDLVDYLYELLFRFPDAPKAGVGLYLDDVPESNAKLLAHERRLLEPNHPHWGGPLPGATATFSPVYDSWVDTTLALYRPGSEWFLRSLRTGWPYQARHLSASWYYPDDPSDEDRYYLGHAKPGPLYSGWKGVHERNAV